MKHLVSLAVLFSLVFSVNANPVKDSGENPYVITAAITSGTSMADDILKIINDYRRKKGLGALSMNATMSAEALKHSENMASHRTAFSHNGFQGRIKRIASSLHGVSNAAENVAMGSTTAKQ